MHPIRLGASALLMSGMAIIKDASPDAQRAYTIADFKGVDAMSDHPWSPDGRCIYYPSSAADTGHLSGPRQRNKFDMYGGG